MNKALTIVMYHYVRSRKLSRFPGLRVRDTDEFSRQLDYIQKHYVPVSAEDIVDALNGIKELPERACFLTFDDGYLDHYLTVFPELSRRGLSGAFYPPVEAVQRKKVLEVNKIQLLLAHYGYGDVSHLLVRIKELYEEYQKEDNSQSLPESYEALRKRLSIAGRYDSADIMFIKAMLQYALPLSWRNRLVNSLFSEAFPIDHEIIASEMYMSLDMLRVMAKAGMHIGSHGSSHVWLDKLSVEAQYAEINQSLNMLRDVYGSSDFMWSVCYPFGGNTKETQRICAEKGCSFGLTTVPTVATIMPEYRYQLSRIDTNDLPI